MRLIGYRQGLPSIPHLEELNTQSMFTGIMRIGIYEHERFRWPARCPALLENTWLGEKNERQKIV